MSANTREVYILIGVVGWMWVDQIITSRTISGIEERQVDIMKKLKELNDNVDSIKSQSPSGKTKK